MHTLRKKPILACLMGLWLLAAGCGMLESHVYDVEITGETGLTAKNIALIESRTAGRSSLRFAVISDTQRRYDETEDVVEALNARGDLDFVLMCGDQSDFGMTDEFLLMRDIFLKLDAPWLTILGNHDCLGTGEYAYRKVYGSENYAFTAGNVCFVCLNTNSLDFNYAEDVPDPDFLRSTCGSLPATAAKTVAVMHAKPYSEYGMFNDDMAEEFQDILKQFPDLQFCVHGHEHTLEQLDLFGDGIIYYQCPNIAKRYYLLFTITEDGYDYEAVYF